MTFISADKKKINLPIPLGAKVYAIHTKCNNACLFQKSAFNEIFPLSDEGRCGREMPCHVLIHSIESRELTLANLHYILEDWGTYCFETEKEALDNANKIIDEHKKEMIKLGLKL